jgi:hypothetical protein
MVICPARRKTQWINLTLLVEPGNYLDRSMEAVINLQVIHQPQELLCDCSLLNPVAFQTYDQALRNPHAQTDPCQSDRFTGHSAARPVTADGHANVCLERVAYDISINIIP